MEKVNTFLKGFVGTNVIALVAYGLYILPEMGILLVPRKGI